MALVQLGLKVVRVAFPEGVGLNVVMDVALLRRLQIICPTLNLTTFNIQPFFSPLVQRGGNNPPVKKG